MPYIDREGREELEPLCRRPAFTKAELNYQVCRLVDRFLQNIAHPEREPVFGMKVGYADLSDARTALLDAAGEIKTRFLDPYEEHMRQQNGDCFHPNLWGRGV